MLCVHKERAAPLVGLFDAFALAFTPPAVPADTWRRAASFPPGACEEGGNLSVEEFRKCRRATGNALDAGLAAQLCAFSRSAPAYAGVAASVGVKCPE